MTNIGFAVSIGGAAVMLLTLVLGIILLAGCNNLSATRYRIYAIVLMVCSLMAMVIFIANAITAL